MDYMDTKDSLREATRLRIQNDFVYHSPLPGQPERYTKLREKAKELAELFNEECPPSRELASALTNLEQAVFWANAAIARNERAPDATSGGRSE